jgi:hypothetical protein
MVRAAVFVAGVILVVLILVDAFRTVLLARRVGRTFHVARTFYELTWTPTVWLARRVKNGLRREHFLGVYGPLSFLLLLLVWAAGLIIGFGAQQWGGGLTLDGRQAAFPRCLYFSACMLFTVGAGEPAGVVSRWLKVLEAGTGLSFVCMVIGYLPILYQTFSMREERIAMLDERAGSPPSAIEMILRAGAGAAYLERHFAEWEQWASRVLEGSVSFPMLAYFRSQHVNQSWLSALTAMTDASALARLAASADLQKQAALTFAMCRHALVDLAKMFHEDSDRVLSPDGAERLTQTDFASLVSALARHRTCLKSDSIREQELAELRRTYEPFACALSRHFLMALPPWISDGQDRDNWKETTWKVPTDAATASDAFHTQ